MVGAITDFVKEYPLAIVIFEEMLLGPRAEGYRVMTLSRHLGVSKNTVRKSLQALIGLGVIEAHTGKNDIVYYPLPSSEVWGNLVALHGALKRWSGEVGRAVDLFDGVFDVIDEDPGNL